MANLEDFEVHNNFEARSNLEVQSNVADLTLCAFALSDCTVHVEWQSAKYLRAVHRTALELAVPNLFGSEIGGYWLKPDKVDQLRKLPDCYPANEINFVRRAVETYLQAQTEGLYTVTENLLSAKSLPPSELLAIKRT